METNRHDPTNHSLMWDGIKTWDRLLMTLREETGGAIPVRRDKKSAKKHDGPINEIGREAQRTDLLVNGGREAAFGPQINLATGVHSLIIDCKIWDGNPSDTRAAGGVIDRVKENDGVVPRDITTDGGEAALANQRRASQAGILNIVLNKIVGSLKHLTRSLNLETRLKKWRSGIEAVISNLKRGFDLFRCGGKTRPHFDAKVDWSVIA